MVSIPHWPKIPIWNIPKKVDLTVTRALLEKLGNPHRKLPPTIHVAGTNGKGSTIAMLNSIFEETGYLVHRYTSPHLLKFNERIQIAGKNISNSHLYDVLERVRIAAEQLNITPTFFEGTTVAAFLAFSETKADILLLETGLGGRLDCTNVIENPILTIITPISFDHMEYLGNDILKIAYEKSGIIKPSSPCVIGPQKKEVYDLLLDKCSSAESPAFCYNYDYQITIPENNSEQYFQYHSQKFNIELPIPNLPGKHQIENASSVIASILLLNNKFQIPLDKIKTALQKVSWPGRLQKLSNKTTNVLTNDNTDIYLDGAHNEDGAKSLAKFAKDNLDEDIYLILGMTRNRDVQSFCRHFSGIVKKIFTVHVESEPSNYSSYELTQKVKASGLDAEKSESLIDAINTISKINYSKKSTIIITGSLFLVSDALKIVNDVK